jgi:hypothetical protein
MSYKIAVITPKYKNDYLTDTILDGLLDLKESKQEIEFYLTEGYTTELDLRSYILDEIRFIDFVKEADIIFFMWGKDNTNYELAEKINKFEKTVFIDGSEVGGNRRYDEKIQKEIENGTYEGRGRIDMEMEKKCAIYFRREKPYLRNIIPLPFGIERKYRKHYSNETVKDIDFFCVFGQDEYPPLRNSARGALAEFWKRQIGRIFTKCFLGQRLEYLSVAVVLIQLVFGKFWAITAFYLQKKLTFIMKDQAD